MSKRFSLQLVRDLAQRESDMAARELAKVMSQEERAHKTLQMLEEYQKDYAGKFEQALGQGISPAALHNYREFLAKLDHAIAQQKEIVRQAQILSRTEKEKWQAQARKVKSYDVLAERESLRQRQFESRREQMLLDEHAASRIRNSQHSK